MNKLFLLIVLCSSTFAYGGELKNRTSYDLGVAMAPTFVPEVGYSGMKNRLGVEVGVSFFDFVDKSVVELKGINEADTSFRLLRLGIASIESKLVFVISPICVIIRDRAYLSSSIGLGEKPYTIFSFLYVIIKGK